MREIKFRAWDKKKKEMLSDEWMQTLDLRTDGTWGVYIGGGMRRYLTGSLRGGDECVFHDDCELLQYIGLKDCKRTKEYPEGQEIYEGDILKVSMGFIWQDKPEIVTWDEYGWLPFIGGIGDRYFLITECKVIGNIFENKELLK
jgi:uncharacterized phage protein (TIGR01671 family)